jgi:hypothetical protein
MPNARVTVTPSIDARTSSSGSRRPRGESSSYSPPNPTTGHEQKGVRPCVVVSAPEVITDQRCADHGHTGRRSTLRCGPNRAAPR